MNRMKCESLMQAAVMLKRLHDAVSTQHSKAFRRKMVSDEGRCRQSSTKATRLRQRSAVQQSNGQMRLQADM